MKQTFKYRIEATKGMAQCFGECSVKKNGKIVRYFATHAEAQDWVQEELQAAATFAAEAE